MHVQGVKTLVNNRNRDEVLHRLSKVRPNSQRRWGSMSAHQMICHLSDSFRAALGEKHVSSSSIPEGMQHGNGHIKLPFFPWCFK